MSTPTQLPSPKVPQSKIIQIAADHGVIYALGDDGSLYRLLVPSTQDIETGPLAWDQILHAPPY
jgi:hypothetical protein